jgi:hypothetical protein
LIFRLKINEGSSETMQKNLNNIPVLILGLTIFLLILLSYLPQRIKLLGVPIKPVDLFMDIKPDSLLNYTDPLLKSN